MYVCLQAQPYGNEWIDYDQTYHRIKVGKSGLYRIPYSQLNAAGLAGTDVDDLKMIVKGQQVPIYVSSSDGVINSGDYVEFVGLKNDGELDTQLFQQSEWQLSELRSLFTDTICYYLTVESGANQRYVEALNSITGSETPEDYFWHTTTMIHNNQHWGGRPTQIAGTGYNYADYEENEGWVGQRIEDGDTKTYNLKTPYVYDDGPNAYLHSKLVGLSDDPVKYPDHHSKVKVEGITFVNEEFESYDELEETRIVPLATLDETTQVSYESVGDLNPTGIDWIAASYTQIEYPREFNFDNLRAFRFKLDDSQSRYIEIENFDAGSLPVLYDMTNRVRMEPLVDAGKYQFKLPAGVVPSAERDMILVNTTSTSCGLSKEYCYFVVDEMKEFEFVDYSQSINQGDYLMVTHPKMTTPYLGANQVQAWADYRATDQGGNWQPVIANIEELYSQFSWGIPKHPLAIRNFVNFAVDNWGVAPDQLLLLGKSVSYHRSASFTYPNGFDVGLVPTYGMFPSDNALAVRDTDGYLPQIGVGRVSTRTNAEVKAYLDKLIEMENPVPCNVEDREWTKDAIHIALAHFGDVEAMEEYVEFLEDYEQIYEGVQFAGEVVETYANSNTEVTFPGLTSDIEDGVALITFVGHSSAGGYWAFNIPEDADDLDNEGKYPFFISASCFVGNIHQPSATYSQAEEYVLESDNGAIGFLATVQFGLPRYLDVYCGELYEQFSDNNYGEPMGECIRQAIENIYAAEEDIGGVTLIGDTISQSYYEGVKATAEEFTLEGDPAYTLNRYYNPEYLVGTGSSASGIQVFDDAGNLLSGSPISVQNGEILNFQIMVTNIGSATSAGLEIDIIANGADGSSSVVASQGFPSPTSLGVYEMEITANSTGEGVEEYVVMINPGQDIDEDCYDNNSASVLLDIQDSGCDIVADPVIEVPTVTTFCEGDGSIQLTADIAGGTYTASGGVVSIGGEFTPTTAGNYTITYTTIDPDTECVGTDNIILSVNPLPTADFTIEETLLCIDEAQTTLVITDYDPTTTYNINPGADGSSSDIGSGNYQLTWSTAGTKTVTMTAVKNGCNALENATGSVVVEVPIATPSISCLDQSTESVTFGWTDITGAESYILTINGTENISLDASTTSYTVTGTTGETIEAEVTAVSTNACGSKDSAPQECVVLDCPAIDINIINLNDSYCADDSDVTLEADQVGGTFEVNGVETSSLDISTLGAGTYEVYYYWADGVCNYSSSPYEVTISDLPVPTASGDEFVCPEGESSALIQVPNTYATILWSTGETDNAITVNTADTYFVTVTNDAGCVGTSSITVAEAPDPTPVIVASETIICPGGSVTLSLTEGYEDYEWSTTEDAATIEVTAAGIYSVEVENASTCTNSATIEIFEATFTTPEIQATGTTICEGGDPIVLSLNSDEYVSYSWSTGETTPTIEVTDADTYTVTVETADGCTVAAVAAADVEVSEINTPTLLVNGEAVTDGSTLSFCPEDLVQIEVAEEFSTYSWNTGDNVQSLGVIENGTFSVDVTNADNCSASSGSVEILFIAVPSLSIDPSATAVCSGETIDLNIATEFDNYTWSTGEDTQNITVTESGTYSVTADYQGCEQATNIGVTVYSDVLSDVIIATDANDICPGETVVLSATGGEVAEYSWTGEGLSDNIGEVVEATPLEETIYYVTLTDENGCFKGDSILVEVRPVCELPNAITPNGDSFNDYWHIPFADISQNVNVMIFNRWGQKVYEQIGYNNTAGWRGTNMDGEDMPHGTYYYIIETNDGNEPMSGHVTVIR